MIDYHFFLKVRACKLSGGDASTMGTRRLYKKYANETVKMTATLR